MPERAVERGVPPGLLGWRWLRREALADYLARNPQAGSYRVLSPAETIKNPLPRNVSDRSSLSRDGALWGYSMHDVPERESSASVLATLKDCRLLFFLTEDKKDFFPALITPDHSSLNLREISFRMPHGRQIRTGLAPQRFERATWILERAYHNHSHWLTAHLPKLILLRDSNRIDDILLPRQPTATMEASMRMLGIDPKAFRTFDPARPVEVGELTILCTDRFRPDLLRTVRDAFCPERAPGFRRVFISRAKSRGRRLLNEDALWPVLRDYGFEKLFMEDLGFEEQVRIMRESRILLAPHGAGLTNMIFCPEGGHVVELADPSYPNPNFYALSCAMGLHYWLIHGSGEGKVSSPLDKNLRVCVREVEQVLQRIG